MRPELPLCGLGLKTILLVVIPIFRTEYLWYRATLLSALSICSVYALNDNCSPFFDCNSADGSQKNYGFLLTGTGGWVGDPTSPKLSQPNLSFWGTSSGLASGFTLQGSGTITVTEMTSATTTQLRYIDLTDNSVHTLLNPSATIGLTASFTMPAAGIALSELTTTSATYRSDTATLMGFAAAETPEPGTWLLLVGGLTLVGFRRRRQVS